MQQGARHSQPYNRRLVALRVGFASAIRGFCIIHPGTCTVQLGFWFLKLHPSVGAGTTELPRLGLSISHQLVLISVSVSLGDSCTCIGSVPNNLTTLCHDECPSLRPGREQTPETSAPLLFPQGSSGGTCLPPTVQTGSLVPSWREHT